MLSHPTRPNLVLLTSSKPSRLNNNVLLSVHDGQHADMKRDRRISQYVFSFGALFASLIPQSSRPIPFPHPSSYAYFLFLRAPRGIWRVEMRTL
jgi:hypothetical protein